MAHDMVTDNMFSVIIPLYNKREHIQRALDSVLRQSYTGFEAIVVDDGSTDGSAELVQGCCGQRVKLIRQPNAGVSAARNNGVLQAKGKYVAFLDADDEWLPHFLETAFQLSRAFPDACALTTAYLCCTDGKLSSPSRRCPRNGNGGEIVDNYFESCVLGDHLFCASSVCMDRVVFNKLGGFPVGVKNGEDKVLWAKTALEGKIAWSPVECAIYHLSADNRASGKILKMDTPLADVLSNAADDASLPADTRYWAAEYLQKDRMEAAVVAANQRQRRLAFHLLRQSAGSKYSRKYWFYALFLSLFPNAISSLKRCLRRS